MAKLNEIVAMFSDPVITSILDDLMSNIKESGGMTPRIVRRASDLLPMEYGVYRSLLLDVAVGTMRAKRLGKGLEGWLFTNQTAEQATHPQIASHHASRFSGRHHVLEICTGAAMDTLALSRTVDHVTSFEADETVAALAVANLVRAGISNATIIHESWSSEAASTPSSIDSIWADPSRRTVSGSRVFDVGLYSPPIDQILHYAASRTGSASQSPLLIGIKTGPGDIIDPDITEQCSSEYIGFRGECRERILWKGAEVSHTLVSLVDAQASWSPMTRHSPVFDSDVPSEDFLIEPHAAIIASGHVEDFLHDVGMSAIDSHIAYGVSSVMPPASPFYDRFAIHGMDDGVSEKKIRRRLAELQWGRQTEFKKRGWPGDPEELRSLLPDEDHRDHGVVFITRRDQGHVTIFAKRL